MRETPIARGGAPPWARCLGLIPRRPCRETKEARGARVRSRVGPVDCCDGDCRETRTVEGSSAGAAEPSRVIGASRANGSHRPIRACWAHGTRGAIPCVADELAVSAPDRDCTRRRALHRPPPPPLRARGHVGRTDTIIIVGLPPRHPMPRGRTNGAEPAAETILGGRRQNAQRVFRAAALRARGGGVDRGSGLGQERSPHVRPRRAGSCHEGHAPTTHRSPTTTGRPRRSDHARRLRRTRGRHLHRARFPTVAVARHGSSRPHTWSRRSPIPNQTKRGALRRLKAAGSRPPEGGSSPTAPNMWTPHMPPRTPIATLSPTGLRTYRPLAQAISRTANLLKASPEGEGFHPPRAGH